MAIDATGWKGPWWKAVRKAYTIPDAVRGQSRCWINVLRLAERHPSQAELNRSLAGGEGVLEALVALGSEGALDHALCGAGQVTFTQGVRTVSDPHKDAIHAIETRGRPISYKDMIGPLWEAVSLQVTQYKEPSYALVAPTSQT